MKLLALTLLFFASSPAAAVEVPTDVVQATLKNRLGFDAVRVEITGTNPKSSRPCSLVANLENGEIGIYDDSDDDGAIYKSIGTAKQSIVDTLRDEDGVLYLHSKKIAPDFGEADFEFTLTSSHVASVKVWGTVKGFRFRSGNRQRTCVLESEPRVIPTFKSAISHLKKKKD